MTDKESEFELDELPEIDTEKEEVEWISIDSINDEELIDFLSFKLNYLIKQLVNYFYGTFDDLKRHGMEIEPNVSLQKDKLNVQINVTFTVKALSKNTFDELSEIAHRWAMLRSLKAKSKKYYTFDTK